MPEIKVECDCGQRFKFDVNPVNGQMPFQVVCPLCGVDGTAKANSILASMPGNPVAVPVATPVAVATPPGLRVRATVHQAAPAPVAEPTTAYAPAQAQGNYQVPMEKAERQPNFWLGLLGAVLGGVIGMLVWYGIYKVSGWKLGFLAIGVGILTGYGARWLGRHHGVGMGLVTGFCALICIIGSQYMRAKDELSTSDTEIKEMYDEELADAKALVASVPNGTEEEIRAHLEKERVKFAAEMAELGQNVPITPIQAEEIDDFREDELKPALELVSGKRTEADVRKEAEESDSELVESTFGKIILIFMAIGIFNIVSIVIGVGTAYKIGAGED